MPPKNTLDTSPAIIAAYLDERAGYMRRTPVNAARVAQVDAELTARGYDVSGLPQPEPDDDDDATATPKGRGGRKAKAKDADPDQTGTGGGDQTGQTPPQ